MPARIIDGNAIGKAMREELTCRIADLEGRGVTPGLAVVLVGENLASEVYVRMKTKACDQVGVHNELIHLGATTTESELAGVIDRLNADPQVHGFIVQLPLPTHIDPGRILHRLDPRKDVDGLHPENVGKVSRGDPTGFRPATPYGIQQLLLRSNVDPEGAHAVIVGRSNLVGRPMANLLLQNRSGGNATVTVTHSKTRGLREVTRLADILIVAMGKPEFITGDMICPSAVVIDVGMNRVDDATSERGYQLVGDVKFDEAIEVASAITPVPGGVGPMTVTMLLYNTVQAAEQWTS